jgi:2-oxoglutarate ferredoxin oxidoreductase subunit alpha
MRKTGLWRLAVAVLAFAAGAAAAQTVRVGSKNFTEQFVLAEIYAQALEAAGIKVERKINLGGTLIAHKALEEKEIDFYPEYTGTMLLAVLKQETIGLGVTLELPLVIVDIQRAGPSTGMPTKPEQADLLNVMFGRNSESPVPVIAAATPSDCFDAALEAARIAVKYRTPVFLLSDAYLANGSEPWLIPDVDTLSEIAVEYAAGPNDGDRFLPYKRDPVTLARPWAIPGTPGLEHRIGGLEKENETGNVSYDPENHDLMVQLRAAKVAGIAADIPELEVDDPDGADTLVLGWGSTYGAIGAAARRVRASGRKVATAHLRYLNPFPGNTSEVLRSYEKVLVPELNLGQLRMLLRAEYLVDAVGYNKVRGRPFRSAELADAIDALVDR